MIVTYKNYEIEVGEHSFDLYQTRSPKQSHLTKGTEAIRCWHGYFSKLPSAIRKIIQVDLSSRDEKVSLSNFIEAYRNLLDELEEQFSL